MVLDEIRIVQSAYALKPFSPKVLCLQRMRFEETGVVEIRVGCYIIGKKPRMHGRWVWGQFATLMAVEDFKTLIDQARERGWI